jgi:hypothetical protein
MAGMQNLLRWGLSHSDPDALKAEVAEGEHKDVVSCVV